MNITNNNLKFSKPVEYLGTNNETSKANKPSIILPTLQTDRSDSLKKANYQTNKGLLTSSTDKVSQAFQTILLMEEGLKKDELLLQTFDSFFSANEYLKAIKVLEKMSTNGSIRLSKIINLVEQIDNLDEQIVRAMVKEINRIKSLEEREITRERFFKKFVVDKINEEKTCSELQKEIFYHLFKDDRLEIADIEENECLDELDNENEIADRCLIETTYKKLAACIEDENLRYDIIDCITNTITYFDYSNDILDRKIEITDNIIKSLVTSDNFFGINKDEFFIRIFLKLGQIPNYREKFWQFVSKLSNAPHKNYFYSLLAISHVQLNISDSLFFLKKINNFKEEDEKFIGKTILSLIDALPSSCASSYKGTSQDEIIQEYLKVIESFYSDKTKYKYFLQIFSHTISSNTIEPQLKIAIFGKICSKIPDFNREIEKQYENKVRPLGNETLQNQILEKIYLLGNFKTDDLSKISETDKNIIQLKLAIFHEKYKAIKTQIDKFLDPYCTEALISVLENIDYEVVKDKAYEIFKEKLQKIEAKSAIRVGLVAIEILTSEKQEEFIALIATRTLELNTLEIQKVINFQFSSKNKKSREKLLTLIFIEHVKRNLNEYAEIYKVFSSIFKSEIKQEASLIENIIEIIQTSPELKFDSSRVLESLVDWWIEDIKERLDTKEKFTRNFEEIFHLILKFPEINQLRKKALEALFDAYLLNYRDSITFCAKHPLPALFNSQAPAQRYELFLLFLKHMRKENLDAPYDYIQFLNEKKCTILSEWMPNLRNEELKINFLKAFISLVNYVYPSELDHIIQEINNLQDTEVKNKIRLSLFKKVIHFPIYNSEGLPSDSVNKCIDMQRNIVTKFFDYKTLSDSDLTILQLFEQEVNKLRAKSLPRYYSLSNLFLESITQIKANAEIYQLFAFNSSETNEDELLINLTSINLINAYIPIHFTYIEKASKFYLLFNFLNENFSSPFVNEVLKKYSQMRTQLNLPNEFFNRVYAKSLAYKGETKLSLQILSSTSIDSIEVGKQYSDLGKNKFINKEGETQHSFFCIIKGINSLSEQLQKTIKIEFFQNLLFSPYNIYDLNLYKRLFDMLFGADLAKEQLAEDFISKLDPTNIRDKNLYLIFLNAGLLHKDSKKLRDFALVTNILQQKQLSGIDSGQKSTNHNEEFLKKFGGIVSQHVDMAITDKNFSALQNLLKGLDVNKLGDELLIELIVKILTFDFNLIRDVLKKDFPKLIMEKVYKKIKALGI